MNFKTEMVKTRVIALMLAMVFLAAGAGCSGGKKKKEEKKAAPVVKEPEKKKELSEDERMREIIVMKIAGVVRYSEDGATFKKLEKDSILKEGYTVKTESDGKAVLSWFDGNLVKLSENSQLKIEKIEYNSAEGKEVSDFNLEKGRVYARAKSLETGDSSFAVKTPTAIAGVRGTQFAVEHVEGASSGFQVVEGTINVAAGSEVRVVKENQLVKVDKDKGAGEVIPIPDDILKLLKEESLEIEELVKIIMILKEKRERERLGLGGEDAIGEDGLTDAERKEKEKADYAAAEEAKKMESFDIMLAGVTSQKEVMLILISHVMPGQKRIALLSVSPDTVVKGGDSGIPEVLKNLYMKSGEKTLVKAVEQVTGLKIKNYVGFNAETVIDLINTVGGVEIEVEKDFYLADQTIPYFIDIKKGTQKLDGMQAAQYAKFKYDDEGMAGSIKRQIKVINGLAKAAASPGTGKKLPQIIERILSEKTMWSNVKAGDSILMGDSFDSQMLSTLAIYSVPTKAVSGENGVDFVEINKEEMNKLMSKLGKI